MTVTYNDGVQRAASQNPAVHRDLVVLDPPMEGRDVANVQRAIRARLKARGLIDDVRAPEHAKWTHASAVAAAEAGYWLGLRSDTYLARTKVGRTPRLLFSQGAQRVMRDPDSRGAKQRARARERQGALDDGPRLEALANADGVADSSMEGALKWAASKVGTREEPAGSNWGGPIGDWINLAGYTSPVPWCGCFVNAVTVKGGVANGAGWIGYTPAIIRHAQAQVGGWKWVGPNGGQRGHVALFDSPGGDPAVHTGVCLKRLSPSQYLTVEGNTAKSDGSQSDGGIVAERERSTDRAGGFYIIGFAIPPWRQR